MRMVSSPTNATQRRLVAFIADISAGIDPDHMNYLATRSISIWDLLPDDIAKLARPLLRFRVPRLNQVSKDRLLAAALEARPDCAAILKTPSGQRWLESNFLDSRR